MSRRSVRREKLEHIRISSGFEIARYQKAGRYCFQSDDLRPCPCGADPVIEKYIYGAHGDLVVRCPACDRRGSETGPYEQVRDGWNDRRFYETSLLLSHKIEDVQDEGFIRLMGAIFNPKQKKKAPAKKHETRAA